MTRPKCALCPVLGLPLECSRHTLPAPHYCDRVNPEHPKYHPDWPEIVRAKSEQRRPRLASHAIRPDADQPFHHVAISTYLTSWTGYGQIGEWLGRGLVSSGLSVAYEDLGTDHRYAARAPFVEERFLRRGRSNLPWLLRLATPHTSAIDQRAVAAFTMWETSTIGEWGVAQLNTADVVIVPCKFNAESFAEAGVKRPIKIVPLGVSASEGYFDDGTPAPAEVCRFGVAGRMAHGGARKGLSEAMAAFVDAFPRSVTDVALDVKVWEDCLPALRIPDDPRIRVIAKHYLPPEMAEWYRRLTCYVVPSKGEGWGLHTHQAMAVGRPVIAAHWSGTTEFWDDRFGWALEYDLGPAEGFYAESSQGGGLWCIPRHDSMVDAMRHVYRNRDEAARKGRAAAARAAEFTWDRTATELRGVLEVAGLLEPVAVPDLSKGCDCGGPPEAPAPEPAPVEAPQADEPTPHPPTLLERAGSLARAVVQHVAAGMPSINSESVAARLAVCNACEHLDGSRCGVCTCYLPAKARMPLEECPLGKWPAA